MRQNRASGRGPGLRAGASATREAGLRRGRACHSAWKSGPASHLPPLRQAPVPGSEPPQVAPASPMSNGCPRSASGGSPGGAAARGQGFQRPPRPRPNWALRGKRRRQSSDGQHEEHSQPPAFSCLLPDSDPADGRGRDDSPAPGVTPLVGTRTHFHPERLRLDRFQNTHQHHLLSGPHSKPSVRSDFLVQVLPCQPGAAHSAGAIRNRLASRKSASKAAPSCRSPGPTSRQSAVRGEDRWRASAGPRLRFAAFPAARTRSQPDAAGPFGRRTPAAGYSFLAGDRFPAGPSAAIASSPADSLWLMIPA